ncbi:hypothetical protein D3C72_1221830 [compost metagenome]
MADRPGEPVGGDVARHRATEGQVLERAGKRKYIATHGQPADLEQQTLIEQCLLVIELHQPGNTAIAVDFLGGQQGAGVGFAGQAFTVAVGEGDAKRGPLPTQKALQVEAGVGHQLVAVGALVLRPSLGVVGQFIDIGELQVHPLLMQTGALPLPVTEQEIAG